MNEAHVRWNVLSEQLLERSGTDSLWGGRSDIVLGQYTETESGPLELEQVFIGEV